MTREAKTHLSEPNEHVADVAGGGDAQALLTLINERSTAGSERHARSGVVTCELIGIAEDGQTPLVVFDRQDSAAIRARSTVDLYGTHIGRRVLVVFEEGDPDRPIVIGILRDVSHSEMQARVGAVELDRDGERMIVAAKHQLVLRCGKAKLTLTSAGKVLIEGTHISSRSSGVNRIKGASIEIN